MSSRASSMKALDTAGSIDVTSPSKHHSSEAGRPPTEQARAATMMCLRSCRARLMDLGAREGKMPMTGRSSKKEETAKWRRSEPVTSSVPTHPCWASCSRIPGVSPQAPVDTQ